MGMSFAQISDVRTSRLAKIVAGSCNKLTDSDKGFLVRAIDADNKPLAVICPIEF